MRLSIFLKRLSDLEQLVADLYDWYAEIFDEDPEANEFFSKMSEQELKHRDLVDFQRRLVLGSGDELKDVPVNPDTISALSLEIEQQMKEGVFELQDAVKFAIKIETNAAETHYKYAIAVTNPQLADLIKSLSLDDRKHHDQLRDFTLLMNR